MPLLTDEKRIAELREQFPTLTHTSWKELSEIEPRPNVDKHNQNQGNIVCATSSDQDFYALRNNERQGMINWSFSYRDSQGKMNKVFIFEKMKNTYYEHVVSSKNFTPVVSEKGVFSGEWVSHETIKPIFVKTGNKEEILQKTAARVFTIIDMEQLKAKMNDETLFEKVKNPDSALEVINNLVQNGILKRENHPAEMVQKLSQLAGNRQYLSQNKRENKPSAVQQAILNAKQTQL